jgi:NAD(P)H dehydrogenase (quinone)
MTPVPCGRAASISPGIRENRHHRFIIHGPAYAEAEQMSLEEIHSGSPYGVFSVSGPSAARPPSEIDLTLARALGRRLAITVGKLREA